jgi:hypothetical protein
MGAVPEAAGGLKIQVQQLVTRILNRPGFSGGHFV